MRQQIWPGPNVGRSPLPGLGSQPADSFPLLGATKASHFGLQLRISKKGGPERTLEST